MSPHTLLHAPSPNFGPRKAEPGLPFAVDMLVIHYTGMRSAEAALDRLCDPSAEVSAHYMIREDGVILALVEETMRAWHAGRSFWRGATDINSRSIGIELVNPGHDNGYRPFPLAQMEALAWLATGILARHPIPAHNIVGHSDIAAERKRDPGELFDWRYLAMRGVGLWPEVKLGAEETEGLSASETELCRHFLSRFGYAIAEGDTEDAQTSAVAIAFQSRFRPLAVTGRLDAGTLLRAEQLLALAGLSQTAGAAYPDNSQAAG